MSRTLYVSSMLVTHAREHLGEGVRERGLGA
jgi:hypothetical protein